MRTLATLVCACLALLAPRDIPAQDTGGEPTPAAGATNAAEEASASAARATSDEPGLNERAGSRTRDCSSRCKVSRWIAVQKEAE